MVGRFGGLQRQQSSRNSHLKPAKHEVPGGPDRKICCRGADQQAAGHLWAQDDNVNSMTTVVGGNQVDAAAGGDDRCGVLTATKDLMLMMKPRKRVRMRARQTTDAATDDDRDRQKNESDDAASHGGNMRQLHRYPRT